MVFNLWQLLGWVNSNPIDFNNYIESQVTKYADIPAIANQFKELWNFKSSLFNDARNNIVNAYNVFEESTNPAFRNYIQTSLSKGNQILSDIDLQKNQAESYYWPGGQAENMINEYLTKYWNTLATKTAENQALAKNVWIRSWASASAVRAGQAAQEALDADNIIKFQEKKVTDLTNLYNTYNTLISQLRSEASTANQAYIIQPLAQILDRQTTIAKALVDNEANLNALKLQYWLAAKSAAAKSAAAKSVSAWTSGATLSDAQKQYIQKLINANSNNEWASSAIWQLWWIWTLFG